MAIIRHIAKSAAIEWYDTPLMQKLMERDKQRAHKAIADYNRKMKMQLKFKKVS